MILKNILKELKVDPSKIKCMDIQFPDVKKEYDPENPYGHGGRFNGDFLHIEKIFNEKIELGFPFAIDFFIEYYWLENHTHIYSFIFYKEDGTPYLKKSKYYLLVHGEKIDDHNKSLIKTYELMVNI